MAFLLPSQPVASTSRIALPAAQSHLPRHLPPLARSSSTATASSSSTSTGTSASNAPRRASSRRLSARPGANLVGPADPLSNLRPVVYGSAFQTILDSHDQTGNSSIDTSSGGASSSSSAALSHPYSTSEFNSLPSTSSASSSRSRSLPPRSEYQTSLLRRLEAAELAHHLRRARADRFSQDFWEDNNRRYTKALEEYRRSRSGVGERSSSSSSSITAASSGSASRSLQDGTQSGSASHPSSSSSSFSSQSQTQTLTKPPKASEDLLSPFYSAWLSANAARHQAYNERLWRITREDLVPAAQYSLLRTWCAVVAWGEAKLGSVFGAGASSRSSRDKEGW